MEKAEQEQVVQEVNNTIDGIIAYEQGDLDEEQTIALFQQLLDEGIVWSLQGHYGRTAQALLDANLIQVKA